MTITSLSISQSELRTIKRRYQEAGQDHLLTFFEELQPEDQHSLYQQLVGLNVDRTNQLFQIATQRTIEQEEFSLEPLSDDVFDSVLSASPRCLRDWETLGLTLIAQGKVAVILMAGGQGTRLGSSDPKGCYNINLPSKKSLFQLQAERILRLQCLSQQYKSPTDSTASIIPWYIMTSAPTHQPTIDFFKRHDYFGLEEENVYFFEQGTLPCLTMEGKIILESKSKVAVAPDGNGGIYSAVHSKGVITDLKKRGILYSHCYCVDNCLVKVADPIFIGYCVSRETDCGVKVVAKVTPDEPVGVICLRNGNYGVVEYSEITEQVSQRRRPDGSLAFGAANIANHFFSTEFLDRANTFATQLGLHIANKKINYVDLESGEQVMPTGNNGLKLERFVFDVFPYARNLSVLEVDRKDEFSPLKNAPGSGTDCPETSRRDMIAQHARFIHNAGGHIIGDLNDPLAQFELSPLVSYGGEGLLDTVQNKTITLPAVIETTQDLTRLST